MEHNDRPNAARLVAAAVVGMDSQTVVVADEPYSIAPPTIAKMAGAGAYVADMEGLASSDLDELIPCILDIDYLCLAVSRLIAGDDSLADKLAQGTLDENAIAFCTAYNLISPNVFYETVAFAMERTKQDSKAESIGNDSLLGQIATFIENLHLSMQEVVHQVPYRNLCIMLKDKLHTVYNGEIMEEVNDEDAFFAQLGIPNPKRNN